MLFAESSTIRDSIHLHLEWNVSNHTIKMLMTLMCVVFPLRLQNTCLERKCQ